jgi:hypothetical protein
MAAEQRIKLRARPRATIAAVLALSCSSGTASTGVNDGGPSGSSVAPPPAAGISVETDAGTGDAGYLICPAGQCLGSDNLCYGPCASGLCTAIQEGPSCSSVSNGGIYCCVAADGGAEDAGTGADNTGSCFGVYVVDCPSSGGPFSFSVDLGDVGGISAVVGLTELPGTLDRTTCTATFAQAGCSDTELGLMLTIEFLEGTATLVEVSTETNCNSTTYTCSVTRQTGDALENLEERRAAKEAIRR